MDNQTEILLCTDLDRTILPNGEAPESPGAREVLRRNARREAREAVEKNGLGETLYEAKGGFWSMNGNYTAGVLEGLAHFLPATREWIEKALDPSESGDSSVSR